MLFLHSINLPFVLGPYPSSNLSQNESIILATYLSSLPTNRTFTPQPSPTIAPITIPTLITTTDPALSVELNLTPPAEPLPIVAHFLLHLWTQCHLSYLLILILWPLGPRMESLNPNFVTKLPLTILILNLQPIRLHHSTLNGVKPWMKSFKLCKDNRHEF